MAFKLGMDATLYRGETLIAADNLPSAITWAELGNVRDLTLSLETGEADVTTRANNGWRAIAATLKDGSIEFEMVWDPSDAGFAAIRDAWLGNAEISLLSLDGDFSEPGNQGLVSNFMVTNFSRAEPLEEAITVSVTVKPSSFTDWFIVPAA